MTLRQRHLEAPADESLTSDTSLSVDVHGGSAPRKTQVKMMSSCPLPQSSTDPGSGSEQPYCQGPRSAEAGVRRECLAPPEPDYSLPFDTITADVLKAGRDPDPGQPAADPLYDSIDEMRIRNIFLSDAGESACWKVEHIYDEPEGCAAPPQNDPGSVYDDPQEMRGDPWRIVGTAAEAQGQDPPFNLDDEYAVPKRLHRKPPVAHSTNEEDKSSGGATG